MIGILQGRLTYTKKKLQWFPKDPLKEFPIAKKLKYNFIEFFAEKNINKKNPIWSDDGIRNYNKYTRKNNLLIYSFCDDYYITNDLSKKETFNYALKILKRVHLLKIKKYIIPLYGKSFLLPRNKKGILKNISRISKICSNYKIELLLESNMSPQTFMDLKEKICHKNCYFLFDTGNRIVLQRNFEKDIMLFGKNIKHIHLKDKDYLKKNVIIGNGLMNFDLLFSYLKKINYKGNFTIESQRGNNILKQSKKNYNFFKNLIKKHKL